MKNFFIKKLTEFASQDPDVILLTADLGFSHFEAFINKFPNQYFNVGIAEQNMIGVAAGLALSGKKVFVYSIASFTTARCFEQIKLDLCYHNLKVIIMGGGAGFSYSKSGATHQAFEDIGIMRTLPNMSILCPADISELDACLGYAINNEGPAYIRLSNENRNLHNNKVNDVNIRFPIKVFDNGKASKALKGSKALILTTGNTLALGMDVAKELSSEKDINLALYTVPLIKPYDKDSILHLLSNYNFIFTIEEHVSEGGFGSLISEILAEDANMNPFFKKFYLKNPFVKKVGSQDFIRQLAGLSKEMIKKDICDVILTNLAKRDAV